MPGRWVNSLFRVEPENSLTTNLLQLLTRLSADFLRLDSETAPELRLYMESMQVASRY